MHARPAAVRQDGSVSTAGVLQGVGEDGEVGEAVLVVDRLGHAAALHAAEGDLEGYRRTCRAMLERFDDTDQPQTAERTAKACLLLSDALDAADFDRVQKLAERAVAGTEKDRFYRYFVLAKGLADYRAGRHADAVTWLQRFAPNPAGAYWDATAFGVLAMAQHSLGRAEEAQASLAKAKAILAKMPDPATGQPFEAGNWHDWLHAQTLCREADALLRWPSGGASAWTAFGSGGRRWASAPRRRGRAACGRTTAASSGSRPATGRRTPRPRPGPAGEDRLRPAGQAAAPARHRGDGRRPSSGWPGSGVMRGLGRRGTQPRPCRTPGRRFQAPSRRR
jgi:hypothetical protein